MGIATIIGNLLTDSGAGIGTANGVATLDAGGKIPATQLPNSVMEFKGMWDASTNTPTLANGTGNAGDVYEVSAAGTVNFGAGAISFAVGDYVLYDGSQWQFSSGQKGNIIGTGTSGQVAYWSGTNTQTGTNDLFWDATNARLGIGTTTPGASLAVNGNAFFAAKITIKGNAAGTLGNSSGLELYQDAVTDTSYLYNFYNGPLLLGTNNTERVRITSGGQVNIGGNFTSTNNTLQVTGNVAIGTTTAAPANGLLTAGDAGIGGSTSPLVAGSRTLEVTQTGDNFPAINISRTSGVSYTNVTWRLFLASNANLHFRQNSTDRLILDTSGNLGLGITPSAWDNIFVKAIQIADNGGSISSFTTGNTSSKFTFVTNNAYYDNTGWKYATNGSVAQYRLVNDAHQWHIAGSGTAGSAISFIQAMTLDASGNLGLGVTPSAWLAGVRAFEIFSKGNAIVSSTSSQNLLTANAYFDGSWKYGSTAAASYYSQQNGVHAWFNAISGTINTAITFTQAMTLDASGRLGIGTTSPLARLDLGSTSNGNRITWANYSNVFGEYSTGDLWLSSNFYGNLGSSGYVTSSTATFGAAGIAVSGTGASLNGVIKFFVDNAASKTAGAAFTPTERMRLDASGRLGIGTTTPSVALDVVGAGRFQSTVAGNFASIVLSNLSSANNARNILQFANDFGTIANLDIFSSTWAASGGGDDVANGFRVLSQGSGGLSLRASSGSVRVYTGSTERMRIDESGNVGIGVTPSAWRNIFNALQIGYTGAVYSIATGTAVEQVNLASNYYQNSAGNELRIQAGFATRYQQASGEHRWSTAGTSTAGSGITFTQAMTLDASGNLLLGTTSNAESARLNVQGGYVYFKETNGGDLYLRSGYGTNTDPAIQVASNDPLLFLTNNTERMRITSGGNLLVGTTTDAGFRLDVNGTGRFSGSSNTILTLDSSNANGYAAVQINASATAKALIGYGTYLTTDGGVAIRTAASTPFTISIGSAVPNFTIGSTGEATFSSSVTATAFIPSGSSVPTNGMYLPSANTLGFATNSAYRYAITSNGVFIGGITTARNNFNATTVSAKFQLEGVSFDDSNYSSVRNSNDAGAAAFKFGKTRGTSVLSNTIVQNGDNLGIIEFQGADGSNLIKGAEIRGFVDGAPSSQAMPGGLSFFTNGVINTTTERMRITSGGNVGIGTTSPSGLLTVAKSVDSGTANVLYLSNPSQTGVTSAALNFINQDASVKSSIKAAVYGDDYMTFHVGSNTERMRITSGGSVGIGTTNISNEANLFLGAKGDEEGGQLVLQKATTWTYAAHIDNYQDKLRIMSGTNTASSSVKFNLDLLSGILNIGATFASSPSANGRFNVDASANQYSGYFLSPNTSGQSLGLYIQAGTNNADYSLIVQSATGTDYFYVMGDGDVRIPNGSIKTEAPTGGTAQPWKLGQYNATAPTATGYVEVDVNGTLYKLLAST